MPSPVSLCEDEESSPSQYRFERSLHDAAAAILGEEEIPDMIAESDADENCQDPEPLWHSKSKAQLPPSTNQNLFAISQRDSRFYCTDGRCLQAGVDVA